LRAQRCVQPLLLAELAPTRDARLHVLKDGVALGRAETAID